jgi:hypothetical protein
LPISIGSVRYPGIKIHETRIKAGAKPNRQRKTQPRIDRAGAEPLVVKRRKRPAQGGDDRFLIRRFGHRLATKHSWKSAGNDERIVHRFGACANFNLT